MAPPAPPTRDRQPASASTLRTHAPLSPSKSSLSRHARASTHLEDELTPEMARLAQPLCVAGLGQAIERDLRRAYRPGRKQLGDAIEMPACAPDPRPQRFSVEFFFQTMFFFTP